MRESRRAVLLSGGGGGVKAKIIITGLLSTDTVSGSDGSNTYTPTWTNSTWVFAGLGLNTYTITATRGAKTITKTVLVDVITEYNISMSFAFTVTISGTDGSSYRAYVEYNSTKYYTNGDTITIDNGDSILVYLRPGGSYYSNVYWNGLVVSAGTRGAINTYTLTPASNCNVELKQEANNDYSAYITGGD